MTSAGLPAWYAREVFALEEEKKDAGKEPIRMAAIGVNGVAGRNKQLIAEVHKNKGAKYIAICDVDAQHRASATKLFDSEVKQYEDFRELLDNKEVQAVTIAPPDHWHTLIAIDACAGARTSIARSH